MSSYETDQISGINTADHNSGVYTEIQGTELERGCDRMQDKAFSKNIWGDKKIKVDGSRTQASIEVSKRKRTMSANVIYELSRANVNTL